MNVANPFSRPSPFRASPQIVTSLSTSPSMPYSYSSPYSNIIESQVRPLTVTDRPSINRTASLNTGVYSYNSDIVGYSASRGYEPSSKYVPNSSSNSSFDVGGEIPTSKSNPFTRPSLLSNNYAPAEPYRPAPSNSYDNLSRNNDYQHLMYTPSSSVPSSSPALSGVQPYADRGYSPNKYTRNNYNTNVNVEDDTASVRSYINKITELQQRSPTDNPFTRRSITSVSPTTHRANHSSTDINTEGYKDYSHLQYQPGSAKSNPIMPDHSGGLDKYRFQYQQQTQRSPHDKYQYSEYSNNNNNSNSKNGNNGNNGYSSYDNIKPALDVQNQEESALANPYKYGSLQVKDRHAAISTYSNNNNNKERASSRDNKHTNDTGQRKYQFEDYHEKQQENNDEDEREFDFNRRSQYEYELQRMEQMLKPNDYQNKQKYYQRNNHNQEQYKHNYDDKEKYDEQTDSKFDTNYRGKPEQLKYTAGFNYTQNNNNNSNNNNNKNNNSNNNNNNNNNNTSGPQDDGNVGSGQYRSPQFGIAPSSYIYREGENVTYVKPDKRNQVVRFDDDDDEQVQLEEVKQYRNPPSFMRSQEAPTRANRGHPTSINYRGSLFYEVELV